MTLVNIPLEIFESMDDPALAMHVYTRVVALTRHDTMQFTKGARDVTLQRGECVFYVRKFAVRWNYNRPKITRVVKAFEKLGFWTVTDTHDGFTIRVRPLQKVPGFAAAQVFEMNRVSKTLIAEARRDFLREQARALAAADQGLYRGLCEEFRAISDSYNSGNADVKPGSEPVKDKYIYGNSSEDITRCENAPAENGIDGDAPSALENAALYGPLNPQGDPSGSPEQERSPSASQAATGPQGAETAGEGGIVQPPVGFMNHVLGLIRSKPEDSQNVRLK